MRASGLAAAAGGRAFNKRVPLENRMRTGILTATAIVILLVALAFVNFATTDVNPSTNSTTATAAPPPPPTQPPLRRDTILSGVKATDVCPATRITPTPTAFDTTSTPHGYAPEPRIRKATAPNRLRPPGDTDPIRVIGGFDATAPDGTDQWSKDQIVTKPEVWFPKDLRRDPVTIDTGGARDWRFIALNPPAAVSKLLIRVAKTQTRPDHKHYSR